MGASSSSTESNSKIAKPHEYRIGLLVCGCYFGLIPPPCHFSLLFLLWASLSSFLVASEQALVVPTANSSTATTASISPPGPLLNPFGRDTTSSHKQQSLFDPKLAVAVGVSVLLFFTGLTFAVMACFPRFRFINMKRKRSSERVAAHDDEEEGRREYCNGRGENDSSKAGLQRDVCPRRFTWSEMEKLTSNFSSVIGSGGFSTVYLVQFPDSTLGAVKIHSSSERLNRVYKQELEILGGLRHDNIVKFLGYCDDREGGVLVFEYVPNGNLQEKLHNHKRERGSNSTAVLPWKSRMAIAYQLAQAIEYLHEKCPLQIVHGDIKASNILIDEQLNCKLCDFGSAKMGFSSTVLPPSSSRANRMMMGSPGYTDPHYLRTGIASKKNDVYSFGVIVLELITGQEALCSENGERLTSIAGPVLKDESRVAEMVDARLKLDDGGFDLEEVKAMASIAAMCLCDSATLRPSASDLVHRLRSHIPSISALLPFSSMDKKSCAS